MRSDTYFYAGNCQFLEKLYNDYLANPTIIDDSWRVVFDSLVATSGQVEVINDEVARNIFNTLKVLNLLSAYKNYGYMAADLDPLHLSVTHVSFTPESYGINDLNLIVDLKGILGLHETTVAKAIAVAKKIYCSAVAVEYSHLECSTEREYIGQCIESVREFSAQEKTKIFFDLLQSEGLENFLHVKFPGAKRFSIEGGESCMIAMEEIISSSADADINSIVLGMAHRGRLNFLTKIFGKKYNSLFAEFSGKSPFPDEMGLSGDVKYHLGSTTTKNIKGKNIELSMLANPSHLEAVNTVVLGSAKAMQDREGKKVLPILIHGDASFAGQGIVYETMIISTVKGYDVGGTIHIIINNQVGFTASPCEDRGVRFASFIGKSLDVPIFHVNGDKPEEVARIAKIAFDYREKFNKDVIIDLICYRRYGHNEGDEPRFTNPVMYKAIDAMQNIKDIYAKKIIDEGVVLQESLDKMQADFKSILEQEFIDAKSYIASSSIHIPQNWKDFVVPSVNLYSSIKTGVDRKSLSVLASDLYKIPEKFNIHNKIKKILEERNKSVQSGENIDWGTAEALAFASILTNGTSIRLAGQDSQRGTFSHRHAALIDQENGSRHIPLNHLADAQKNHIEVINSPLSEYGVLGFEYGYSLVHPNGLTIWEAQFGDFANGAQIIIDQFISGSYMKWVDYSGIVLLLPHGYEGQGPEHSSARIERFLQLSAENNMQIINCSTPANYFHALRRQVSGNCRSPMVIFTPKSLLRHKLAVSKVDDFAADFKAIIPDNSAVNNNNVKKVILCSGKIYYELLKYKEDVNIKDTAIIRVEQLYPFPETQLISVISCYKNAKIVWAQEEPKNMGAWFFVKASFDDANIYIEYCGRKPSAATACGYLNKHNLEQKELLEKSFN